MAKPATAESAPKRRRPRPGIAAAALVAIVSIAAGDRAALTAAARPDYILTFSDEFDDPSAQFPNARWSTVFNRWGGLRTLAPNKEAQIYLDPTYAGPTAQPLKINPFSVSDGALTIEARPTSPAIRRLVGNFGYSSGLLVSTHSQLYGYFEIRVRVPAGRGLWPAFWLVGEGDHGDKEIDVFEVLGHKPDCVYQTTHDGKTKRSRTYSGIDTSDGFHTYGLEWTAREIVWFVDGKVTQRQANFVHVPMYMLVNLAVGGHWGGDPDHATHFPARLNIDYIRAYHRDAGVAGEP